MMPRRVPKWYVRNDNDLYRKLYQKACADIATGVPSVSELRKALAFIYPRDPRGGHTEALTDAIMAATTRPPIVGSDGKVWATCDGWRERA